MTWRRWFVAMALAPVTLRAQQQYGFVARLGVDTISVEQVRRSADRLVSDEVDRFPRVTRRHTEISFGADQRVTRVVMDITLPTAITAKWKSRRVTAEYGADTVRVTVKNGERSRTVALATGGAVMLPWTPHQYSLSELYFDQALRQPGDSMFIRHFYIDMQADEYGSLPAGLIPGGYVRRMPGGKAELFHHDGLAGSGVGTLDDQGRMLAYSGARSTYKVEVVRVTTPVDVQAVTAAFTDREKREGVMLELSIRDTSRASIGAASFMIDYGRPLARGRNLVGDVIPYGQVWRTGANAATQFTTSAPITLGGLAMAAGTYTLWSLPDSNRILLIVNNQHGQWGTQYDPSRDLGRVPVTVSQAATPVERMTLSVVPADARHGVLRIEWGSFRWESPIEVR